MASSSERRWPWDGVDDDVVIVSVTTPTKRATDLDGDSGEKPKKARTESMPESQLDYLDPLEKELLKEYERDEVGGNFNTFVEERLVSSLTHSVASQLAQAAPPASAMYGHLVAPSRRPKSPSLSPERDPPQLLKKRNEPARYEPPPQLPGRYYDSGTLDLDMWDPEFKDAAVDRTSSSATSSGGGPPLEEQ